MVRTDPEKQAAYLKQEIEPHFAQSARRETSGILCPMRPISCQVCSLLRKLAMLTLWVHFTVFLENARDQNCTRVMAMAANLQIELCFLPAYSPDLNLIERLWKFVKKQCLYSKYYADFTAFKTAIIECLNQTHTTHKSALSTLLTLRFQLFEKEQFVTM